MANCPLCLDHKTVGRFRKCGTRIDRVTCPMCVRGVTVLGTHELLRPLEHDMSPTTTWEPGTILSHIHKR